MYKFKLIQYSHNFKVSKKTKTKKIINSFISKTNRQLYLHDFVLKYYKFYEASLIVGSRMKHNNKIVMKMTNCTKSFLLE